MKPGKVYDKIFKKVCHATSTMNIGALVGKRGNQLRQGDLDASPRAEDDGRTSVCEACCNFTSCNNGGACGVKGTVFDLTCIVFTA